MATARIAIILNGGLIQNVLTYDELLVGCDVAIIDRDTEGLKEDEETLVLAASTGEIDFTARVHGDQIALAGIFVPGEFEPGTDSDARDQLEPLETHELELLLPDRLHGVLFAARMLSIGARRGILGPCRDWFKVQIDFDDMLALLVVTAENNRLDRLRPKRLI